MKNLLQEAQNTLNDACLFKPLTQAEWANKMTATQQEGTITLTEQNLAIFKGKNHASGERIEANKADITKSKPQQDSSVTQKNPPPKIN